jgi:hypothetical protein
VLAHYGYVCQLEGPRCTGYATTVHHLVPSSQAPELFWEPTNLAGACGCCNYGDGARVAAENTRRTIEDLRLLVERQQAEIDRLIARLSRHEDENGDRVRRGRTPGDPLTHRPEQELLARPWSVWLQSVSRSRLRALSDDLLSERDAARERITERKRFPGSLSCPCCGGEREGGQRRRRSVRLSIVRSFVETQEVEELPDLVVVLSGMTHRR